VLPLCGDRGKTALRYQVSELRVLLVQPKHRVRGRLHLNRSSNEGWDLGCEIGISDQIDAPVADRAGHLKPRSEELVGQAIAAQ
jgi:hypothetical protein